MWPPWPPPCYAGRPAGKGPSVAEAPAAAAARRGPSAGAWHRAGPADARGAGGSADAPIADVGAQGRVEHLDGLEAEGLGSVEDALTRTEQDGCDVEGELVDHAGDQRLSHGRGPTGDVHTLLTGCFTRCDVRVVEAPGHEVERRAPLHPDRVVAVMGEYEDRRVVRRLGAPPAGPVRVPVPTDGAEHVPPHHVRTPRAHEPLL